MAAAARAARRGVSQEQLCARRSCRALLHSARAAADARRPAACRGARDWGASGRVRGGAGEWAGAAKEGGGRRVRRRTACGSGRAAAARRAGGAHVARAGLGRAMGRAKGTLGMWLRDVITDVTRGREEGTA